VCDPKVKDIKSDGTVLWLEKFPLIGNFITNGKISIPQDTEVTSIHAAKQQFCMNTFPGKPLFEFHPQIFITQFLCGIETFLIFR
jgi:hypothetical protein